MLNQILRRATPSLTYWLRSSRKNNLMVSPKKKNYRQEVTRSIGRNIKHTFKHPVSAFAFETLSEANKISIFSRRKAMKLRFNFTKKSAQSCDIKNKNSSWENFVEVQLTKWGELKVDHASLRTRNNWKQKNNNRKSCVATSRRFIHECQCECLLPFLDVSGKLWSWMFEMMPRKERSWSFICGGF